MGKFKGVVKKTTGTLKKFAFPISIAGTLLTFVCCMGTLIGMGVNDKSLARDYKSSSMYQNYVHEQQVDIEEKYNNGELTLGEYMKKVDAIEEDIDIKAMIKSDIDGNEEYQERLKFVDDLTAATIAFAALTGAGMASMIACVPLSDKLEYSAQKDLQEAEDEFRNAAVKKAGASPDPKPKQYRVPKVEKVDISDEDKEFKSLDEEYYVDN